MDRLEDFEKKCVQLERNLHRQKPTVELSKGHQRLLDLAESRASKNGVVVRNPRKPKVFDDLVDRGLITEYGKFVEQ